MNVKFLARLPLSVRKALYPGAPFNAAPQWGLPQNTDVCEILANQRALACLNIGRHQRVGFRPTWSTRDTISYRCPTGKQFDILPKT